jgi:hypothetical protein
VVLLVARAGAYMTSTMAAVVALEGVDKARYPFTVQQMRAKVRTAGAAGLSFAQLRGEMTALALDEPVLFARGAAASSGGGGAASGGSAGSGGHRSGSMKSPAGGSSKQLRVNALQQQLRALMEAGDDDGDDTDGTYHTAPVGVGGRDLGPLKCYKCGKEGHVVAECKSKAELRKCYRCQEPGHVRSNCPEKMRTEGQAGAGGQGGRAGAASAQKNE